MNGKMVALGTLNEDYQLLPHKNVRKQTVCAQLLFVNYSTIPPFFLLTFIQPIHPLPLLNEQRNGLYTVKTVEFTAWPLDKLTGMLNSLEVA